jgi:hypothetical protein
VPAPSQVLTLVSAPPVQLGVPHEEVAPGKLQALGFTPSQRGPQDVPAPVPVHAARPETGAPRTVVHLPTLPVTLHA